jgi:dTDP-4-dehydrorhamnose 3,5-epimerase
MNRFAISDLSFGGVKLVERKRIGDRRGFLARLFCAIELAEVGWTDAVAQVNHTYTAQRGTVRGMHFQRPPHAEMKLVTCLRGEVWDVALDLRLRSPTYLRWRAEVLSADNGRALLIPPGFAHGFQALSDDVELLYCHSKAYNADAEAGANPRDTRLAIAWPLPIGEISDRDARHPWIGAGLEGVDI